MTRQPEDPIASDFAQIVSDNLIMKTSETYAYADNAVLAEKLKRVLRQKIILGATDENSFSCTNIEKYNSVALIGDQGIDSVWSFLYPYIISAIARGEHIVVFDHGTSLSVLEPLISQLSDYQIDRFKIDLTAPNTSSNLVGKESVKNLCTKLTSEPRQKHFCIVSAYRHTDPMTKVAASMCMAELSSNILAIAKGSSSRHISRPVCFCSIDGRLFCNNPDLMAVLSEQQNYGLRFCFCFQSIDEISHEVFHWTTLMSSFRMQLYFGNKDLATAHYLLRTHSEAQYPIDKLIFLPLETLIAYPYDQEPVELNKLNLETLNQAIHTVFAATNLFDIFV